MTFPNEYRLTQDVSDGKACALVVGVGGLRFAVYLPYSGTRSEIATQLRAIASGIESGDDRGVEPELKP